MIVRSLLCISYRFPPETYPLASRVAYMLGHLEDTWSIRAITAANPAKAGKDVEIHHVKPVRVERFLKLLRRFRLAKLIDWLFWPDPFILWVIPAFLRARKLIKKEKPDLILVFMMPYSTGFVGLLLRRLTGLPVVFNLNDSPTCTDMNPSFPSRWHYRRAGRLEDRFVRAAESIIYVSGRNMTRVRDRQPPDQRQKFHLIRRGAPLRPPDTPSPAADVFRIVYTGGMGGWYPFLDALDKPSLGKHLYQAWQGFGRYRLVTLDHRSHSPVFIGQAIKKLIERHPEWAGRIEMNIYGNRYPDHVVNKVLDQFGIAELINVHPPVVHHEAVQHAREAALLFMALPERMDGSPGGRISAKTYEYLMTDRPILAAVPPGENEDFLHEKPGVYLVKPREVDEMARVLEPLVGAFLAGDPLTVDRADVHQSLTIASRTHAFATVLDAIVSPAEPRITTPEIATSTSH